MDYKYLDIPCHQKRISIVKNELLKYNCHWKNLSIGCWNWYIEKWFPGNFEWFDMMQINNPIIPITIWKIENILFFYTKNQFDAIFAGETLEHIYEINKTLSDIKYILKPNGIFIITIPNILSFRDRIRGLFWKIPRHINWYLENEHLYEHIRHFSYQSIKKLLENHWFKILRISTPSLSYNPFSVNSTQEFTNIPDFLAWLGNNLIITASNQK
jgi:SAM-dependent methyltransferase